MQRKGSSSTVAVTADEVRAALARTRTLTSEEEKVLRLRHGVNAPEREALPRADGGNAELADELLILEMQLMKAHRLQRARASSPRNVPRPSPESSRAKDKIVRALRRKK